MREVVIRALFGLLYVTLLLLAIFSLENIYIIVFFALGAIVLYEFLKLIKVSSILPYILLVGCTALFCYFKMERMITVLYLSLVITVNLYLIKNLIRPSEKYITISQNMDIQSFIS